MVADTSFIDKKVLVFDLDGTIVKLTAEWHALKTVLSNRFHERFGKVCEFKSISSCLEEIVRRDDEEELNRNFDLIRKYELDNIEDTEPVDEIIYFIKHLSSFGISQDIKIAVFSLNTRETILRSLRLVGLSNEVDIIVGREDVRSWKPHPDGLLIIQEYFGVTSRDMIYFGDMKKDLIAGKNAAIDAYLVDDLIKFIERSRKKRE
jgi:phosphoglycolate phosphatase-like HAD superfamily hydrolase